MNTKIREALQPYLEVLRENGTRIAKSRIEKIVAEFEANDWDLNKVAPFPRGRSAFSDYDELNAKHKLYLSVSGQHKRETGKLNAPFPRSRSLENEKKFVEDYIQALENEFEAYVLKMENKIGPVHTAELELGGGAMWYYSVLKVDSVERGPERWKTQMIVNVSKLGKLFNQFPTRKVK